VLGDQDTVFGDLDAPSETLPAEYRAHGSLHEINVPLVIHHAEAKLSRTTFSPIGSGPLVISWLNPMKSLMQAIVE